MKVSKLLIDDNEIDTDWNLKHYVKRYLDKTHD